MCIEFWVILYIWNDMIEKLCPGLALCSISNQLLLLYSSKIIFPIRAAFFCLFTNMEAWSLVSTSQVLCTADSAFYCMLNYDGHILGCKTLIATWYWRPCACQFSSVQFSSVQSLSRVWLFVTPWIAACQAFLSITNCRSVLSCTFRTCDFPSCLSSLLIPHVEGTPMGGWVTAHRIWAPAWAWTLGATTPVKADVLKVLPCERSMSRGWSQSMQMSGGCHEHVSPGHRSCPQMPPRLLGWLLLQLLHLQGGWGHCGATVCRSTGAAVPACSLWRSPMGASSSPSAGPSSGLQPPKGSRGHP